MSHNTSKEGFSNPKIEEEPSEFLSKSPYKNSTKVIYL